MPARSVITINDGLATPVAHNFAPQSGDGNVPGVSSILFEDRSAAAIVGYNKIVISTRKPTAKNRNHKVTVTVMKPVLEVLSNSTVSGIMPAPTVAYTVTSRMEFIVPERSDLAARKDLLAYVRNLLANAVITTAIETLESPW